MVARKEDFLSRLVETAVTGFMSRRMNDGQLPAVIRNPVAARVGKIFPTQVSAAQVRNPQLRPGAFFKSQPPATMVSMNMGQKNLPDPLSPHSLSLPQNPVDI